jgi:putative phosphoesterase
MLLAGGRGRAPGESLSGARGRGTAVPMSSHANIEGMSDAPAPHSASLPDRHTIGIIADTHGLLRPGVSTALDGVELIVHAGDVGDGVLQDLAEIAPVKAVRGNTDPIGDPDLPLGLTLEVGGLVIHVTHGNELGVPTPEKVLAAYEGDVLIYGHTHRQIVARDGDRLVVNPGSAGPRRFNLLPSLARLTVVDGFAEVEIIDLDV